MTGIIEYIRESKKNNRFSVDGILVYVDRENTNNLNYSAVVKKMTSVVPRHLFSGLEKIMISPYEKLKKRNLQGMYKNRTIFLTGTQPDELEILDDLIHEVSHYVEEIYDKAIYSDGKIKQEFLRKRRSLKSLIQRAGYPVADHSFEDEKYNIQFDEFLYLDIGYKNLGVISSNIFYSPYAATSLKEYFANGFEAYFYHQDLDKLASISPVLFDKLENLSYNKE